MIKCNIPILGNNATRLLQSYGIVLMKKNSQSLHGISLDKLFYEGVDNVLEKYLLTDIPIYNHLNALMAIVESTFVLEHRSAMDDLQYYLTFLRRSPELSIREGDIVYLNTLNLPWKYM
jgi:hypothetical protein